MNPRNLIYTFVSYASHYDTPWGRGTAVEGIERTAAIAHRHGIPVTWIVNRGSIPVLAARISEWHEAYGDDVILQCPFFIEDAGMSKDKLKETLASDWRLLQETFPWAQTKIAGRGKIYNEVIETLEELGFEGMWGYCWEQVWWDGITHKGIPWGSWYVDGSRYKVPHPGRGQVVAFEWTARDLHLTYHTGSPVLYSTDPNDVLRAGLCTGQNIEYWKRLFDEYMDNTEHNEQVFFLQQQEGHEMEYGERFAVFPAADVEACAEMLDLFFAYVAGSGATLATLPQAVARYKAHNAAATAPVYMLTRDKPFAPALNDYTMTLGGVGLGPWPDTFLYYDSRCQMAFVRGECKPRMLRSYVGQWDMSSEFTEPIPPLFVTRYERTATTIELIYEIGIWKPIPFGLAYWDDLAGYEIESCEIAAAAAELQAEAQAEVDARLIGGELVFLRFALSGAKTKLRLVLRKRS
ncbi:hypothetical protein [Cohnella fermenti]|uniref:Uncharacterized protein n=1 Tax=Cohnella fermenti TaxID=2565925 RepID=A0A4S4BGR2_9BACL|nr:hypothetical protein [Cohnella fermenti]THF73438.1 hypothetical protein E6C55_29045 [Cohnella fermenti]